MSKQVKTISVKLPTRRRFGFAGMLVAAALFAAVSGAALTEEGLAREASTAPDRSRGGGATAGGTGSGATEQPAADAGASLFSQKCGGCHTIGKGNLVGPDLKGVASWGATEVESNVRRMEKFTGSLSDRDVKALVDFLKDAHIQQRMKSEEKRAVAVASTAGEPASEEVGGKLFHGSLPFINGGTACIACHQVEGRGGTMGKALDDAFEKFGQSALVSTCEQPSYPVMKAVYREHPVTRQEALHVTRYLSQLKTGAHAQELPFAVIGTGAAFVLLACIMLLYRNRNKGVHAKLTRR